MKFATLDPRVLLASPTPAADLLLAPEAPATSSAAIRQGIRVADDYYFGRGPSPFSSTAELWKSDGSAAGTVKVASFPSKVSAGADAPSLSNFTASGARFFFTDYLRPSSGSSSCASGSVTEPPRARRS